MTSWTPNSFLRLLTIFLLLSSAGTLMAQDGLNKRSNVNINSNCNGYLEYLPKGYTGGTKSYPLIVYLNGLGSTGDGSDAALENEFSGGGYPHEQARQGIWPDTFALNGKTYQFLIITPQFVTNMGQRLPTFSEINDVISYSIAHYRIDTSRIYLMGQSQGGGLVWDYTSADAKYARRLAA